MSSKSTASSKPASATTSNNASAFTRRSPVAASRHLTSETIASDIAMFKQRGGRIEVLGNTVRRSHLPSTTFRPNAKSARKAATTVAAKNVT
jgi:hypothetical protein